MITFKIIINNNNKNMLIQRIKYIVRCETKNVRYSRVRSGTDTKITIL